MLCRAVKIQAAAVNLSTIGNMCTFGIEISLAACDHVRRHAHARVRALPPQVAKPAQGYPLHQVVWPVELFRR